MQLLQGNSFKGRESYYYTWQKSNFSYLLNCKATLNVTCNLKFASSFKCVGNQLKMVLAHLKVGGPGTF
jgi:hypothetical protein